MTADATMGSTPYYADELVTLHHGDCLDVLATLPDCSVDAVVTDPPYGLGFMGKEWDDLPPGEPWARECLRVLKPGGHLLAFGGTRTAHRLACAIEDAGFELRDSIAWLYGSGFPKSLDVSKAIDRAAGAVREVVGYRRNINRTAKRDEAAAFGSSEGGMFREDREMFADTVPATPNAVRWEGWGTALKPAHEPIIVARKPPVGTVAANVLAYGVGALNIDGCRVEGAFASGWSAAPGRKSSGGILNITDEVRDAKPDNPSGRWPTNVALDFATAADLDRQSGMSVSPNGVGRHPSTRRTSMAGGTLGAQDDGSKGFGDTGGASRFFPVFRYEPKAPTSERPRIAGSGDPDASAIGRRRCAKCGKQAVNVRPSSQCQCPDPEWTAAASSQAVGHPTVKPLDLMRWLVRLVTPPDGLVLEPFAGSGTTAEACIVEGFRCIAIEREADYLPLILARINKPIEPVMFGMETS